MKIKKPKFGVYPMFDLRYSRAIALAEKLELHPNNKTFTKTGRAFGFWSLGGKDREDVKRRLNRMYRQEFGEKAPIAEIVNVNCYDRGQSFSEHRLRVYVHITRDELVTPEEILERFHGKRNRQAPASPNSFDVV